MDRATKILLAIGGAIGLYLYLNRQQVTNTAIDIEADVSGWKNVQQGPKWVPYIEFVEQQLGIPPDLLARMAYQESRFREDIITGTTASSAGALGILQLMPAFFKSVQVPVPFTDADTQAQIQEAGNYIVSLYKQFGDWGTALAAYNFGPGNEQKALAGQLQLPAETVNYVTQILADVDVGGSGDTVNA